MPGENIAGMEPPKEPSGIKAPDSPAPETPKAPGPNIDRFIGFGSLLGCALVFVLQENGVEMNWQASIGLYALIALGAVYSSLRHAVPHLNTRGQNIVAFIAFAVVAALGCWGTNKQYRREHPKVVAPLNNASAVTIPSGATKSIISSNKLPEENSHSKSKISQIPFKPKNRDRKVAASDRPLLYLDHIQMAADQATVQVIFKNSSSQYAGLGVTTYVQLAIFPTNFDISNFAPVFPPPGSSGDVAPESTIMCSSSTGKIETPDVFEKVKEGKLQAIVFVKVHYNDLGGNSYEPRSCARWNPVDNTFATCPAILFTAGEKP